MIYNDIDIFCQIIDNFGDIGVVNRFAREFKKAHSRCKVRVFVNELDTFKSFCPTIDTAAVIQEHDSIQYINSSLLTKDLVEQIGIAGVLVEAFGCVIPDVVMETAYYKSKILLNLEYLSAENWVEEYHLKESLLPRGTLKKYFYMPGFTLNTGGVILNHDINPEKQSLPGDRLDFLNRIFEGIDLRLENTESKLFGSIFTYTRGFLNFLSDIRKTNDEVYLLIFGDKSKKSIMNSLRDLKIAACCENHIRYRNVHFLLMPFLSQELYDKTLRHMDFNFVRGEDSLVRAILSGKPFIWNAYIQENKYQKVKVQAFLKRIGEFFEDESVFRDYSELMLTFNDAGREEPIEETSESYLEFFKNINKIEHATTKMSYFMFQNCDLINKFSNFLSDF